MLKNLKKIGVSYGWLVVIASTLAMMGVYGTEISYGVLFKPIIEEYGWSRTVVAAPMSMLVGFAGLMGVVSGRLTDKYGARIVLLIGSLLGAAGTLLLSQTVYLWHLYVFFSIFVGISQSAFWTPLVATTSKWFVDKRVLAVGIVTSGLTIGQMIMPPVIAAVIADHGWRSSCIIMGIAILLFSLPAIVILGEKPPQQTTAEQDASTRHSDEHKAARALVQTKEWRVIEAVTSLPFIILMTIGFVTGAAFYFLTVHIVAYVTDLGIVATTASLIFTFMCAGNISGKTVVWSIAKKLGIRNTFILLLALQALAMLLLMWVSNIWLFFTMGAIFGFGLGATMPVRYGIIAELFGTKSVGVLVGIMSFSWAAGGIIGPIMAGYIFDLSHSYNLAFISGALLEGIGILATLFLVVPSDQRRTARL